MQTRFVEREADAQVVLHTHGNGVDPADGVGCSLSCPGSALPDDDRRSRVPIRFATDRLVPWPFRGRLTPCGVSKAHQPLVPTKGEIVIAESPEGPVWTARAEPGGHVHFRSALPLLELPPGGSFAQVFSGSNYLSNLPLIQMLAHCGAGGLGSAVKNLRASFMFDDPNLHWPTYGYVRYAEIAAQAARENFHVAFATIPLDTWFTHDRVAGEFRARASRISLLVHGNDHTRNELTQRLSPAHRAALLRQALRRIERLERRTGVTVDRIMVPPHGACSWAMLASLPAAGFDAACLSSGSLQAHNPTSAWVRTLGFRPAEIIMGCPVLPRWALTADEGDVLAAAFLGRPIILRGHHGDLKDGADALTCLARLINSLGAVQWASISELLRASHKLTISGTTAHIVPYARQIALHVPEGVRSLAIRPEASDGLSVATARYIVRCNYAPDLCLAAGHEAQVRGGTTLLITLDERLPPSQPTPRLPLSTFPVLRRLMTETRDRLMPLTINPFGRPEGH